MYFNLPNKKLTAGGRYADKQGATDSESEAESEKEEDPEEEEQEAREEDYETGQRQNHFAQVHASATRVSTQPRSKLGSNERVIIDPHTQSIIVVKKNRSRQTSSPFPSPQSYNR